MTLSVLSDLHIRSGDDPLYGAMNSLVRSAQSNDILVLAGDIFDLFVGNKQIFKNRYKEFILESRSATNRGVKIYFIEGNHDFLLKKALHGTGVIVKDSEVNLNWNGKNIHIAHGDRVNRRDYSYLFLRLLFRSPLMKALVAIWPDTLLDRFGASWSIYSRKRSHIQPDPDSVEALKTIYRDYAEYMMKAGCDLVVLGHCHILDEWKWETPGRSALYFNMGFPPLHGRYIRWSSGSPTAERVNILPTG